MVTREQQAEHRAQWVAELRSGKYKKGTGFLHQYLHHADAESTDEYCCLGVACELFDKANPGVLKKQVTNLCAKYDEHSAHLPPPVVEWLGLTERWGQLVEPTNYPVPSLNDEPYTFHTLSAINDSLPDADFAIVAGLIEQGKVKVV